jgi:hypothetical protein
LVFLDNQIKLYHNFAKGQKNGGFYSGVPVLK